MLIDSLLYDACSQSTKSLNQIAINVDKNFNVDITKQGVSQRFTAGTVKYIQTLIGNLMSVQITRSIDVGWFKYFNRVLIKDSTKFDVSENMAKQLPGFGGNASEAGVSIQYEFDIKAGETTDLNITPANRPDARDTSETLHKVRQGDLIIRDLGYSSLVFFAAIHKIGAYFIARLNASANVYELKQNKFIELDFEQIYKLMKKGKIQRIEKNVYIGKKDKLPVRIIIELIPEEVVNKRLRKVNNENKKNGHNTSDKYKSRNKFNIFITNVEDNKLETDVIVKIYKIRWQVELIFKAWKSIFGIDNNNKMKYERFICLLNVRLILILINWDMFMQKRQQLYMQTKKLLSVNKCFKTMQDNSPELSQILTNNCKGLINWLKDITQLFEKHHWLEKKKDKLGLAEIMTLNVL